jgi:hypothetical protein
MLCRERDLSEDGVVIFTRGLFTPREEHVSCVWGHVSHIPSSRSPPAAVQGWSYTLPNGLCPTRRGTPTTRRGAGTSTSQPRRRHVDARRAAQTRSLRTRGLGFSEAFVAVRLVCAGWKAVHDAMVRRMVLRRQTTDEAVGMHAGAALFRRWCRWRASEVSEKALTDAALRAVSSLSVLSEHSLVTDEGMRAASLGGGGGRGAAPTHRPREDGIAHPAHTSRSNLAASLGLLS